MNIDLNKVINLRKEGKLDKALSILNELLSSGPNEPDINYQTAGTYDSMGNEKEAVKFYEKAIEYGLSGEDLKGAFIGLGSTYRCLGRYEDSLNLLNRAIEQFPEEKVLKVFRSLTLYNLGQNSKAIESLLVELLDTTSDKGIQSYEKALRFYSDKLNETW